MLAISLAKTTFSHDNNPNAWAQHDVGQAVATLAIQAVELGLQCHQMPGFSSDAVRAAFHVPVDYEPVAVFTIGYPSDTEALPEALQQCELAARTRKPLAEYMFEGDWPQPEG